MRFFAFITLLIVGLFVEAQLLAVAADDEWIIRQTSPDSGLHEIYVCATAVKLVSPDRKVVLLMKRPNWDVVAYNETSKKIFELPAARWKGYSGYAETAFFSTRFSGLLKTKEKPISLSGLSCLEQHFDADAAGIPVASRNIDLKALRMTITQSFNLPPTVCRVIANEYYLPPTNGLPLLASYQSKYGAYTAELRMTECRKQAFKSSDFVSPEGYTQVSSAEEIWRNKKSQISDFYEMIK